MTRLAARVIFFTVATAIAGCGFAPAGSVRGSSGGSGATGLGGVAGSGNSVGSGGSTASGGSFGYGGFGNLPEAGAGNSGSSNTDINCGQLQQGAKMVPPDILIVQDRSLSMLDDDNDQPCDGGTPMNGNCGSMSKWAQTSAAVAQAVAATETTVNWGMIWLGDEPMTCGTSRTPVVPVGPMNANAIQAAFTNNVFNGQAGTPTTAVIKNALAYLQGLTDTNPKYLLLATDGEPNCANNNLNADDATGSTQAIADALTAGFPTFVIGIGATGGTATLNSAAMAGGRPQAVPPASTYFYQVNGTSDLVTALQAIVGSVASCTFNLGTPPSDLANNNSITVYGDGNMITKDPTNTDGWNYVGSGNSQIQFYGSTCTSIMTGAIMDVTVTYACVVN